MAVGQRGPLGARALSRVARGQGAEHARVQILLLSTTVPSVRVQLRTVKHAVLTFVRVR